MSGNGYISFNQPWDSDLPAPFPQPVPIIVPFWTHFNAACGISNVSYWQTTSKSILSKAANEVQGFIPSTSPSYPSLVVIVTWNQTRHSSEYNYENKVGNTNLQLSTSPQYIQ